MTIIDVNQQFLETTGLKQDEIIGKTASAIGMSEEVQQNILHVIHEYGEVHNAEIPLIDATKGIYLKRRLHSWCSALCLNGSFIRVPDLN